MTDPLRTARQCRERYRNNLRPTLFFGKEEWKVEEDETIYSYQSKIGNQWAIISSLLPGRSDNAVKNRFNSKKFRKFVESKNSKDFRLVHESKAKSLEEKKTHQSTRKKLNSMLKQNGIQSLLNTVEGDNGKKEQSDDSLNTSNDGL